MSVQAESESAQASRGPSKPKEKAVQKGTAHSKKVAYASLRVRQATKKRIEAEIEKLNQKEYGRRIRADEILALALSLVTPQHLQTLQDASLSHADRLKRDYRAYVAEHGAISEDEYLGKRLTGEIAPPTRSLAPDQAKASPTPSP